MSTKKFFSVIVGGEPNRVQVGFLNEDGKPKEDSLDAYIERAGTAVPNYSRVWGKRILETKTKEPTGEITFLPWDHEEGHLIEIRYLKTSQSLDMEYQKKKGMRVTDADAEIHLVVGVNNFEPVKDKMLIEMLKHHYQNGENRSRDPQAQIAFNTYDPEKVTKLKTTDVQMRQEAENMVINANNSQEALEVLASLFHGIEPRQQHDVLFSELMDLTPKFKSFMEVIEVHRDEYSTLIEKAKEIELIDVEQKNAVYLIKDGGKEILIQDIKCGDLDKMEYLLKYYYEPENFKALTALKAAYEKYAAVLQ